MLRFAGKTALVTGASAGIGRACSFLFAEEGARLILVAREHARLEALASEIVQRGGQTPLVLSMDLSSLEAVPEKLQEVLPNDVDVLVNNAGGGGKKQQHFLTTSSDLWQQTNALNLGSAFFVCQAILPTMAERGDGAVVNVASLAGRQQSLVAGPDYAAAKAGLIALSRHLAAEYGSRGVRVNTVAPGLTLTERVEKKWNDKLESEREEILGRIPLGRAGQPDEIARAVLFLASNEASYITGATLDVNGGAFMP